MFLKNLDQGAGATRHSWRKDNTRAGSQEEETELDTTHRPHGARAPVLATRHPVKATQTPPTHRLCRPPGGATVVVTEVLGQLRVQHGLKHVLGELTQQPSRATQTHALIPGPRQQPLSKALPNNDLSHHRTNHQALQQSSRVKLGHLPSGSDQTLTHRCSDSPVEVAVNKPPQPDGSASVVAWRTSSVAELRRRVLNGPANERFARNRPATRRKPRSRRPGHPGCPLPPPASVCRSRDPRARGCDRPASPSTGGGR